MINGFFYLHNYLDGALLRMDMKTGQMELLDGFIDGDEVESLGAACCYIEADGGLYMVQKDVMYLMRYDLSSDKSEWWPLPCTYYTPTRPNTSLSILYNGEIYIFPAFSKQVYVFSLSEKKIVREFTLSAKSENTAQPWNPLLEADAPLEKFPLFAKGILLGTDVWLFPGTGNEIICYNLENNIQQNYVIPACETGYVDVCFHGDRFYMLSVTGAVATWSPGEGWQRLWDDRGVSGDCYGRLAATDQNIWLLPSVDRSDIEVYDFKSSTFMPCPMYPENFEYCRFMEGQGLYGLGCEDEDWYYFAMPAATDMLWVNKHTGQPHWLHPQAPNRESSMRVLARHKPRVILEQEEGGIYSIDSMIEFMLRYWNDMGSQAQTETSGQRIYEYIMEKGRVQV